MRFLPVVLDTFAQKGIRYERHTNPQRNRVACSWYQGSGLHLARRAESELGQLRGKPVILAFYPADWSPTCGDQIGLYNEVLPEFQNFGAELLGISVDGPWCHKAYSEARNLHFRLLSDFEPKGAVAREYGTYRSADGFTERALFVIDKNGIIAWSYLSPIRVNPGADGILQALESLPK